MRALGRLGLADASCRCTVKKEAIATLKQPAYWEVDVPNAPLYNLWWSVAALNVAGCIEALGTRDIYARLFASICRNGS